MMPEERVSVHMPTMLQSGFTETSENTVFHLCCSLSSGICEDSTPSEQKAILTSLAVLLPGGLVIYSKGR